MTLIQKIEVMEAFEQGDEIEASYKNKEKQTVVIEEWLITDYVRYDIIQTSDIDEFLSHNNLAKVKLLNTYEVEL